MSEPDFYIEVYKGKKQGRQRWRWRALNYGNFRKMATSGEAYTNVQDCIDAATALFSGETTVHLHHPDGEMVLRTGLPEVTCLKCGHSIVLHVAAAGCDACGCVVTVDSEGAWMRSLRRMLDGGQG